LEKEVNELHTNVPRARFRGDRRQRGQALVEYAIILVLVSTVVIVMLFTVGNQVTNVFSNVSCALGAHCPTPPPQHDGD